MKFINSFRIITIFRINQPAETARDVGDGGRRNFYRRYWKQFHGAFMAVFILKLEGEDMGTEAIEVTD